MPLPPKPTAARDRTCPGHLLVLVCDAAQRHLLCAETALEAGRIQAAGACIRRAQCILVEVMDSVDRAAGSDLSEALAGLCQDLINGLSEASAFADEARVRSARRQLLRMRDALAREHGFPA